MKIFKSQVKLLALTLLPTFFLLSCENDTTDIGANLIPDKLEGNKTYVDLVAYNMSNNDTIRADYNTLGSGLIGIYEDNTFGKSKASFNIQVRLSTADEIKGTIQQVDSVVLSLNPAFNSSSYKEKKIILNPGSTSGVDTIKYVKKYTLASYLGKAGNSMEVNVNRINTFLESTSSKFYSNKTVDVGDKLGTALLGDSLTSISVKTSDGKVISEPTAAGYRIKLDPDYFYQYFFSKKGSADISDNSRFIQYFKGIKIQPVDENSKFMFNFPISKMTLIAYYRYKDQSSDNFTPATYSFTMNSAYNSMVGEYNFYNRNTASSQFKQQMQNPDKLSGESILFLQGMGGPSIHLKLDDSQLEAIKDSVQNHNWAITGAKLKFHLTENVQSKPDYIYGYNYTQKKFLPDLTFYSGLAGYFFNPKYDFETNPQYYTLNVTKQIKDIVEKNKPNDEILVEMGNFMTRSTNSNEYLGYSKTTRAYEPFRLTFYGNKNSGDKKLRLEILYTKN